MGGPLRTSNASAGTCTGTGITPPDRRRRTMRSSADFSTNSPQSGQVKPYVFTVCVAPMRSRMSSAMRSTSPHPGHVALIVVIGPGSFSLEFGSAYATFIGGGGGGGLMVGGGRRGGDAG